MKPASPSPDIPAFLTITECLHLVKYLATLLGMRYIEWGSSKLSEPGFDGTEKSWDNYSDSRDNYTDSEHNYTTSSQCDCWKESYTIIILAVVYFPYFL